jgi:hypothetical protein
MICCASADTSAQLLKPGEIVYGRTQSETNGACATAAIWAIGLDGSNDRFVTYGRHPRISPDGRKILFKRWQNVSCTSGFEGGFGWFIRDLATGVETQIGGQNGGATGASFSPETNRAGLQITADESGGMCQLNTNGGRTCYFTQIPPIQGFGHSSVRGGDYLIVAQNYDDFPVDVGGLYTLNYNRTNILKIPNTTYLDLSPSWSNDGQKIAYALYVNPCCRTAPYFFVNLFKINPDGSNKTQLTNVSVPPGDGFAYSLVWTQDNSTILNAAKLNGVTGIYKIDANGGGVLGRVPVTPGQPVEWVGGIVPPFEEKEIAAWGGGVGTGKTYTLVNTIGQAFAGQISSGERFNLQSGFWTYDAPRRAPYDFDGDGKTDIGIFRPSDGSWWYSRSSDNGFRVFRFGISSDLIAPGDFTGDGLADIAVFRATSGEWFVQRSEDNSFFSFPFGTSGDVPVPSDYDGDGKTDAAVFRPSSGTWFILNSNGSGTSIVNFGTSEDKPVAADFDGDGKADIAIFRPSDGSWWYLRSSDNQFRVFRFGLGTDKPVQGDFTGDGRADIAVFRPSTGVWFVQRSEDDSFYSVPFGTTDDLPAPGDYDGDGRFDTAVFRPTTGNWFVQRSSAGIVITTFGTVGDRPIPNAFVP